MKNHIKTIICLLLAASMLLGAFACAGNGGGEPTPAPNGNTGGNGGKTAFVPAAVNLSAKVQPAAVEGRAADQKFIAAQADFAVTLFQNSLNMQGNTLVSPLSVMLALAMTANGADGETLAGMEKALGGSSLPIDELNEYLYHYIKYLPSGEKYKVTPANSIWIRDGFAENVKETFLQKNADYYGAAAYRAPFDDTTLADINGWVKENTDGMIEKVIDSIDPSTVMFLINALIFDAEWAEKYESSAVHDAPFHPYGGGEKTVSMMYSDEYFYLSDNGAEGFIKPYAGDKYSFAVLMPQEGTDIYDYIKTLSGGKLLAILNARKSEAVSAGLPKFSYDYELLLNNALSAMGMSRAFDPNSAEFTKMSDSELYISKVIHKTFIEVAEQGTRAGAVTVVAMDEAAMMTEHTVILDRPFVYMILDNATNLPIFIGCVTDIA